jgi:uncharacterized protein (TIGR03792 family)
MGWLLKRRGYENTVLFEARDRLGGFVWTRPGDRPGQGPTTITRELGAAFLSPDYVEVRALLKRYGEEEVPLSVKHMMHFHTLGDGGQDVAEAASAWYNGWVKEYTGTSDPERNGELVGAGLKRYYALHESIFGTYPTRFPPRPRTPGQMQRINGTAVEFLERNNLTLLRPLMYQFFVLQGMGLIDQMSAYYMLKWCSPKSMQLGGFGNDHDFPLAMLKDGYGGIVNRLAKEVDLDVRYGHRVVGVKRGLGAGATLSFGGSQGDETCDVLVLSGPITQFVRGSNDGSTRPILTPPSLVERSVFEGKQAMQFLVSLVEFDRTPAEYEALEFWPEHFRGKGNVIVRRDVGYAETNVSHAVGGIQSFSYYPYPQCNRSVHWDMQQRWAKAHNRTIKQVIGQFYIDTYYYHYSNEDVLAGKPWDLENAQMGDGLCNCTMYVGGCASYETVEDSFHHNLALVHRLFDQPPPPPPPAGPRGEGPPPRRRAQAAPQAWPGNNTNAPAIETLFVHISCKDVDRFIAADNSTWTSVLKRQPGFVRKLTAIDPDDTGANCTVYNQVFWSSRTLWKSVPDPVLKETDKAFSKAYGSPVPVHPYPPTNSSNNGLTVLFNTNEPLGGVYPVAERGQAIEFCRFVIDCRDIERFVDADTHSWTPFLQNQAGFMGKTISTFPTPVGVNATTRQPQCALYTLVRWGSTPLWKQVCGGPGGDKKCRQVQEVFETMFGSAPAMTRIPSADGLIVQMGGIAPLGPRLIAIGGNDVVAYYSLTRGERDVKGSPLYRRYLDSAKILPPSLLSYHPQPYEFWFSTNENAEAFEKSPWMYIPANGGHCTHGIASGEPFTRELIADGRIGFTCINTTEWYVLNGTLYMNSCGMYYDFIKDPEGDARKSASIWKKWFGAERNVGPINDACFQDGQFWNGNPTGALIPTNCVLH